MRLWSFLIIPAFIMVVLGACGGGAGSKVGQSPDGGGYDGSGSLLGDGGGCQPKTCGAMGYDCGMNADGCGNLLSCGTCTAPTFCGAGGFSKCGGDATGDGGVCTPKTCTDQGFTCGPAGDGCGNMLSCGACNAPAFCGGGGFSKCGGTESPDAAGACVPSTCAAQNISCGVTADGCGNLLQCGSCQAPQICGGGSAPGVCGDTTPCTGLCLNQVMCPSGVTTTFTGQVVAGTQAPYGSPDPVPNVIVYVPNAPVLPFTEGVQCNQCGADVSGAPLIETTTDYLGNFTLTNVPVPPNGGMVPVVIQLGRWRRQLTFPVTSCATTSLGPIHMPRNQTEGDIPLTAISTGQYDALECVLVKMGVDTTEFTIPGGGGRIEMYQGNGVDDGALTPDETALTDTAGVFENYDQVLFPCWGEDPRPSYPDSDSDNIKTSTELSNFNAYVNAGGRVFATHYSYSWLFDNPPFSTVATWAPDSEPNTATANIQQTPAEVNTFYMWMNALTANGSTAGQFTLNQPRYGLSAISTTESELWIEATNPAGYTAPYVPPQENPAPATFPLLFTTNTPVQAATQCGRVIFSGFHVVVPSADGFSGTFPSECAMQPMSSQEKALEYLIWDLASCVPGPPAPLCRPLTCAQQSIGCGPAGDGCGNTIQCGPCTAPQTCGGGGVFAQCGDVDAGGCVPQTCAQQNIACGPAGDGCGNAINCGPCTPPQTCGGGGTPGQCGFIDGGSCTPQTCQQLGVACGPSGDGCGGTLSCGVCTAPETCGGGGMPGICGGGSM